MARATGCSECPLDEVNGREGSSTDVHSNDDVIHGKGAPVYGLYWHPGQDKFRGN